MCITETLHITNKSNYFRNFCKMTTIGILDQMITMGNSAKWYSIWFRPNDYYNKFCEMILWIFYTEWSLWKILRNNTINILDQMTTMDISAKWHYLVFLRNDHYPSKNSAKWSSSNSVPPEEDWQPGKMIREGLIITISSGSKLQKLKTTINIRYWPDNM